jgi:hypothetical protein
MRLVLLLTIYPHEASGSVGNGRVVESFQPRFPHVFHRMLTAVNPAKSRGYEKYIILRRDASGVLSQ